MKTHIQKCVSLFVAFSLIACYMAIPAFAGVGDALDYTQQVLTNWMNPSNTQPLGGWSIVDFGDALFQSNKEQKYYTQPTESVEDSQGNVINYYRGGDTTNTKIIDSYNRTFNTIHNTTSNNYSANVKLNEYLTNNTTYNNNYRYSADFKSWYYDNDTNNYNYTTTNTYYNTDNSRYYISIDNSTDEYYLVDVQYSPTFVTVNYTYNTTNVGGTTYGDVTNVYYYELDDGRNSYTLTVSEALGIASGYDVTNYVLVPDDPDTLSLQHFDGNYDDSSAYGNSFYSENRSTTYVDSGDFNKAVKLSSGSSAGVSIPILSSKSTVQIDFRAYFDSKDSLTVWMGDTCLYGHIPRYKYKGMQEAPYTDDNESVTFTANKGDSYGFTDADYITSISSPWSTNYSPLASYNLDTVFSSNYGAFTLSFGPYEFTYGSEQKGVRGSSTYKNGKYSGSGTKDHYKYVDVKKSYNGVSVPCTVDLGNFLNQWVNIRIVLSGGNIYFFVNGDSAGSGSFSVPFRNDIFIHSLGTVFLDELRVSSGSLVNTSSYTPSSQPYDTNMVLALPDTLQPMTIYVRHQTPINGWRIGGVRPSAPATGFFYLPLYSDYTGAQPQLYDGSNWVDVDAVVSADGTAAVSVIGYKFTPASGASDVDPDLQPGRPSHGSEDVTNCQHDWVETSRKDATCEGNGSIEYECSKCKLTKSQLLAATGHVWVASGTVATEYDDSGNVVTQGYTLYRCSVCGTEFRDTDGSGPPMKEDNTKDGILKKLFGGLFGIIESIIGGLLDGLISLVTSVVERLSSIVNLFGSFGESLSVLWSWLPSEVVTLFVTGITVIVFAAVIKLFVK